MVVGMVIFFTSYWINKQGSFLYSKQEIEINDYVSTVKLYLDENPSFQTEDFIGELTYFADCAGFSLQVNLTDTWEDWREDSSLLGSRVVEVLNHVYEGIGVETILSPQSELRECFATNATSDTIVDYLRNTEIVANHQTDIIKDLAFNIDFSNTEFKVGAWMALITGCLVSLSTAMVLIPSYVSSVMKFRSGYLPSLGDREFLRCRFAPDVVAVLLGSAFWGTFFTSIAAMILSAVVAVSMLAALFLFVVFLCLICSRPSSQQLDQLCWGQSLGSL